MFSLADYDYRLPQGCIAQKPLDRRDRSRLLKLDRKTGGLAHHRFDELVDLLAPTDVIVVNNTRVIPGRLMGRKETGGKVEVLVLDYAAGDLAGQDGEGYVCECLINAARRTAPGAVLTFDGGVTGTVLRVQNGKFRVRFSFSGSFDHVLESIGRVPLPPYIRRDNGSHEPVDDATCYQTVYASQKGAVAAPTAGLHFTNSLMSRLQSKGIKLIPLTLHVGYGTFAPVRVADVREHRMHAERFQISPSAAAAVNHARQTGGRIICVGTTCVRALEYACDRHGVLSPGRGACDLFIYPGYEFKIVDALITNFHLPKSTLLMLVSAFASRDYIMKAYHRAIAAGYRFYSYGDAMLIE